MMKIHKTFFFGAVAVVSLVSIQSARAGTLQIAFTGMNLVYDGSSIRDAGSPAGGVANPADADPLASVDFLVDNVTVGNLTADISLDAFIPDITNIPSAANTNYGQLTTGNPGYFDLLIGTSPLASQYLAIDLNQVNFTYIDALNLVQFTFGAAVSSNSAQNLPFGLQIGDPVTVSFSAQVVAGSKTTDGGFVTGFNAAGTGQYEGAAVPEPTMSLLLLSTLATAVFVRRRS